MNLVALGLAGDVGHEGQAQHETPGDGVDLLDEKLHQAVVGRLVDQRLDRGDVGEGLFGGIVGHGPHCCRPVRLRSHRPALANRRQIGRAHV